MTEAPCRCQGLNLDKFVHCSVLTVLAKAPLHGYLLVDALAQLPSFRGCAPDPAGVYRVLREMEGLGLVLGTWEQASSGPAKRSYAITQDGLECLAHWIQALMEHQQAIGSLLKQARAVVSA